MQVSEFTNSYEIPTLCPPQAGDTSNLKTLVVQVRGFLSKRQQERLCRKEDAHRVPVNRLGMEELLGYSKSGDLMTSCGLNS